MSALRIKEARDLAASLTGAVAIVSAFFYYEVLILIGYSFRQAIFKVSVLRPRSFLVTLANINFLAFVTQDIVSAMVLENATMDLIFRVPVFFC
jgi:hypothetical protein